MGLTLSLVLHLKCLTAFIHFEVKLPPHLLNDGRRATNFNLLFCFGHSISICENKNEQFGKKCGEIFATSFSWNIQLTSSISYLNNEYCTKSYDDYGKAYSAR